MRVSSLSDPRVIRLVTRYYVPAWLSRDHYQLGTPARAEQQEIRRLDDERHRRGFEGGTVCVFLVSPDGSVLATQRVQAACHPENLAPLLEKVAREQRLRPRSPAA